MNRDPETNMQYQKEWRAKNKEKIAEYWKKRRASKEYKQYVKKWREEHKEEKREYGKEYRRNFEINKTKYIKYGKCPVCGEGGSYMIVYKYNTKTKHFGVGRAFVKHNITVNGKTKTLRRCNVNEECQKMIKDFLSRKNEIIKQLSKQK